MNMKEEEWIYFARRFDYEEEWIWKKNEYEEEWIWKKKNEFTLLEDLIMKKNEFTLLEDLISNMLTDYEEEWIWYYCLTLSY